MSGLREDYRRRQRLVPALYEAERERGLRTIREFDERITAPYGGYRDADDYYAHASAGPRLSRIRRPALLLAALDDPLIPGDSVARWAATAGTAVRCELRSTGGHVGFFAPSRAPGRFWAADHALAFLHEHVQAC